MSFWLIAAMGVGWIAFVSIFDFYGRLSFTPILPMGSTVGRELLNAEHHSTSTTGE